MEKIKIAIIDDGIYADKISECIVTHYSLINGYVVKSCNCKTAKVTHGEVCAYILSKTVNNADIIDIKVFKENKASADDIVGVLNWCTTQSISIINMSFGTSHYLDAQKIKRAVQQVINRGIFVVAAHNNLNIISYPAACKGVIGVRSDKANILKHGEIGYKPCNNLYPENCFIAHNEINSFSGTAIKKDDYSFAAPIITGLIAKNIQTNPSATFKDIFKKLINTSNKQFYIADDISKTIFKMQITTDIPVIAFYAEDLKVWQFIRKSFIDNGYNEVSFCEIQADENVIPIEAYAGKHGKLSKAILSTIATIYEADVFLFCINKERFAINGLWDKIDVLIKNVGKKYVINTKDKKYENDNFGDLFNNIIELFTNIDNAE